MYASTLCVNASMPVPAVRCGGRSRVSSGSAMASTGIKCGLKTTVLRLVAVMVMVGLGMGIYVAGGMLTRFDWQFSYMAAILMMIGIAHGISAAILRWRMQGLTAAVY